MASVIITMRIMPTDPEVNLDNIQKSANDIITKTGAKVGKVTIVPIAFGLNSIEMMFIADESKGSTDDMEAEIAKVEGINSVEVIDVRRAIG